MNTRTDDAPTPPTDGLSVGARKNARRANAARHAVRVRDLERACAGLERDVAERTREVAVANERLAVVAREAVHRVGNLLCIVRALTRQTAGRATDVTDFAEALLGRLSSIDIALRQALIDDGSGAIDLVRVVETQLDVYRDTYPGQIELEGPSLPMCADAARMIGLAIHELATNAVKHGALATPDGRVDVRWGVTRRDGVDRLDFRWCERAGGARGHSGRTGAGFGTRLLGRWAPAQLRGSAVVDLSVDGLRYHLDAPLP
ncbi:sensor histidine kinase [Salinarimonas ramus]|uniref:histidine kinase n=1 Tax=Salinarimonas ramus TaxID=690164 RepID=A0A917Q9X5_9HYPH|nr:sensor histidine kinase [Salinarimonas ramus]GGK38535.1 hypothetical protein GCM10011322_26970 [Salinarimonas ramus]